jgi:predicted RNase H-like HicB family nuclease
MELRDLKTQKAGAREMKSYVFSVVLEPDEQAWRAYVPELEARGAATWGKTREEALLNIQEVLQMVVEGLLEDGESLPRTVAVSNQPTVAVNVG